MNKCELHGIGNCAVCNTLPKPAEKKQTFMCRECGRKTNRTSGECTKCGSYELDLI